MKLRYVLIVAAAVAGFGASLALADDGHKGDRGKGDCKHGVVLGLANAPQSLTLTVREAVLHAAKPRTNGDHDGTTTSTATTASTSTSSGL